MRFRTAEALRDALEQRLRNQARDSDVGLLRLRKRVAFERFLARLATADPDGWVLKGAFALEVRLGLRARATKDVDLGRPGGEQAATRALARASKVPESIRVGIWLRTGWRNAAGARGTSHTRQSSCV